MKNNNDSLNSSILKEYFSQYLIKVRGLKQSSVNHYLDALNNISRLLKFKGVVKLDIYEVDDFEHLLELKEILYKDSEFARYNERGRRMYSAGLNNYLRFAGGIDFSEKREKISLLDIPIKVELSQLKVLNTWKRSTIIRNQAIEYAGFMCELDNSHESFIAENTKRTYMEGHHAISMKYQSEFMTSLDIYANIVCLCPICHRRIHFGLKQDRLQMINQIYDMRETRLANSGIRISKSGFTKLTS